MTRSDLHVLHVIVQVGATNGQYNEHCLPLAGTRDISVCSLRKASVIPPPEITLFEGNGGTILGAFRRLRAAEEQANPEVVHVHAPASAALLLAVHLVRRRSLANCVFTLQNSYQNFGWRNRLLLYVIFRFFPAIVLCSESVRQSLPTRLRRLATGKDVIVPNAVDVDRIDRTRAGQDPGPDDRRFTVVVVSRLVPIKNLGTVLQAFERVRDRDGRLVVVGDGPLAPQLAQQVAARGLAGQVTFTGLLERDEVFRAIRGGDVCVSASCGEGLPVAVMEAMACGRPVILSDIEPHREIARGIDVIPLVPPDDVDGFAEQIRRFRAMSASERAEIGGRCRQLIDERYSLSLMHTRLNDVYARVLDRVSVAADSTQ